MEHRGSPDESRGELHRRRGMSYSSRAFCGYLIWNCMANPLILADAGFETKELRYAARRKSLHQLKVVFRAWWVTRASVQTFHFDKEGYLRRSDYPAAHDDHTPNCPDVFRAPACLWNCRTDVVSTTEHRSGRNAHRKTIAPGCRNLRRSLRVKAAFPGALVAIARSPSRGHICAY
jgi:hypothetical protein